MADTLVCMTSANQTDQAAPSQHNALCLVLSVIATGECFVTGKTYSLRYITKSMGFALRAGYGLKIPAYQVGGLTMPWVILTEAVG
jgi:hypothetical protein